MTLQLWLKHMFGSSQALYVVGWISCQAGAARCCCQRFCIVLSCLTSSMFCSHMYHGVSYLLRHHFSTAGISGLRIVPLSQHSRVHVNEDHNRGGDRYSTEVGHDNMQRSQKSAVSTLEVVILVTFCRSSSTSRDCACGLVSSEDLEQTSAPAHLEGIGQPSNTHLQAH